MDLATAVDLFVASRERKGLTPGSLALYRRWLDDWQRWRTTRAMPPDLAAVSDAELRAWLHYLAAEHVPHSRNPHRPAADRVGLSTHARQSCWRTLRAAWHLWRSLDLLTDDQAAYFVGGAVPRPVADDPDGIAADRAIDADTVAALLAACDPTTERGARDRAILRLLHATGLRVAELCRLDDAHVDQAQMTARVRGKGGVWGHVFWDDPTARALDAYLVRRSGSTPGPLVRGCSSRNPGGRLTGDAVRGMITRLARRAGVTLPPNAPVHGFRSGFAQAMLDAGVDSLDLQQLMRHRRLDSTMIYVKRHPAKLRAVYQRARRKLSGL